MSSVPPEVRTRPLWWWALWLVLGLALGAQALRMRIAQAAVEAQSGVRAVMIRPQNAWGQALLAEKQFSDGQVAAAKATSRRALESSPLPVTAVRTLAQVLDSKAKAGGEHAWQIASMMGWRDRETQLWALLRALSNGQTDVFVMRADALMRTRDDDPQMISVIRQALVEPHIRGAFVHRIALDPEWRERLFTSDRPLAGRELEGTLLALRGLGDTQARPQRDELRDTIAGLIASDRFAEAVALDRRFVLRSPDKGSLIDDGGFEQREDYRKAVTPFDWTILKSATLDQSGGRKSMLVIRDGKRTPLVRRFVALPAGAYRLDYALKGDKGSPQSIGIRVRCAGAGADTDLAVSPRTPLAGDGWQRRSFAFAVPDDCPLTRIDLTAIGDGDPVETQFDDISIAPLR